jgi:hypothetical protein
MRNRFTAFGVGLSLALLSFPAVASANFACTGTVTYLGANASGEVLVDIGKGVWGVCNLSETYKGVTSAQACQGWYSALVSAKLSGKSVVLWFSPDNLGNDGITSCEGLGNWSARTPYHVALP